MSIYHNKQCVCSSGPALTNGIPTNAASRGDVETAQCPSAGALVKMTTVHPQLSSKALPGKGHPPTHTHLDGFQGYYAEGKDQSQGHGCMISYTHFKDTMLVTKKTAHRLPALGMDWRGGQRYRGV